MCGRRTCSFWKHTIRLDTHTGYRVLVVSRSFQGWMESLWGGCHVSVGSIPFPPKSRRRKPTRQFLVGSRMERTVGLTFRAARRHCLLSILANQISRSIQEELKWRAYPIRSVPYWRDSGVWCVIYCTLSDSPRGNVSVDVGMHIYNHEPTNFSSVE